MDYRTPNIYDPSTLTEPYAYARANPVMFWDPNGLKTTTETMVDTAVDLHNNDHPILAQLMMLGAVVEETFAGSIGKVTDTLVNGDPSTLSGLDYTMAVLDAAPLLGKLAKVAKVGNLAKVETVKKTFAQVKKVTEPLRKGAQKVGRKISDSSIGGFFRYTHVEDLWRGVGWRKRRDLVEQAKNSPYLNQKVKLLKEAGYSEGKIRELIESGAICFAAGTLVLQPDGSKPIEQMRVGDTVLAWRDLEGQGPGVVTQIFTTHPERMVAVRYREASSEDRELHCTPTHPFYVLEQKDFLAVENIQPGSHFLTQQGEQAVLLSRELIRGPPGGWTTYNLEIHPQHTYFVQPPEQPHAPALLVHNSGDGCTPIESTFGPTAPNSPVVARPSARQSEIDVTALNPNHRPQVSFNNGKEVSYGSRGSVRPDNFDVGEALEVKNYDLLEPANRANLYNTVRKQYLQRKSNLPNGTHQRIVIDIRGQNLPESIVMRVRRNILTITRTPDVTVEFLR